MPKVPGQKYSIPSWHRTRVSTVRLLRPSSGSSTRLPSDSRPISSGAIQPGTGRSTARLPEPPYAPLLGKMRCGSPFILACVHYDCAGFPNHYRRSSSDASDPVWPAVRVSRSLPDVFGQTLQKLLQGCTATALKDRSHSRVKGYRVAFQQTLFRWHMHTNRSITAVSAKSCFIPVVSRSLAPGDPLRQACSANSSDLLAYRPVPAHIRQHPTS
jgi:hypothetical protein